MYVDNGYGRAGESELASSILKRYGVEVQIAEKAKEFLHATCHLVDPESKRKTIGNIFIETVHDYLMENYGLGIEEVFLAQGTLQTDLIESGSAKESANAATIKTHHNDSPFVRKLREKGLLIEPLAHLHKDQVRALGELMGLEKEIVWRQPFPGPGFSVRVICEETKCTDFSTFHDPSFQTTNKLFKQLQSQKDDELVIIDGEAPTELLLKVRKQIESTFGSLENLFKKNGISMRVMPVKTVGIQGDGRSFKYFLLISHSHPQQERNLAKVPWSLVWELSRLIPMVSNQINRVVFLLKRDLLKCKSIILERTMLHSHEICQVREADSIANKHMMSFNMFKDTMVAQMPVVLLPLTFDFGENEENIKRSVVLRPFITKDFLTGKAAKPGVELPFKLLDCIYDDLISNTSLSAILLDCTNKPPGTTEWQ